MQLKRLKNIRELNYLDQKEKLHNAVKGRAVLKSLIAKKIKPARFSDSSSSSELSLDEQTGKLKKSQIGWLLWQLPNSFMLKRLKIEDCKKTENIRLELLFIFGFLQNFCNSNRF